MTAALDRRTGRVAGLLDDLRRSAAFRALVPMEALLGFPIPVRHREPEPRLYLTVLPHGQRRPARRGEPTALFAPLGAFTLEWPTGRVVEWVDARYRRSWTRTDEPVAAFPHDAVRALPLREYHAQRDELLGLYDDLFDAMAAGTPFDDQARFGELLRTLVPPDLLPWYRAQAPQFIERFFGDGPSAADPGA